MSIFGVYTFGLTFYLALGLTGSVKRALGLTLIYLGIYFFLFIITDLPDDFLDYLFFIIVLFVALLAGKIKEKKYECRPLNDYGFEFKEFYFYTNIRDGINEQKKMVHFGMTTKVGMNHYVMRFLMRKMIFHGG